MIGLMPFTGGSESFPTARVVNWSSYAYNASTNVGTGSFFPTVGRYYIMIVAGSDAGTYMNAPSGAWTLLSQSQNTTFYGWVATSSTVSYTLSRTGSGSFSKPIIYEVVNHKSTAPTYGNANVYSGVTSVLVDMILPDKNSLILGGLWLAASRTVTATSSGGAPTPVLGNSETVGSGELKSYMVQKAPLGNYSMTTSWTTATNARLHLISIK